MLLGWELPQARRAAPSYAPAIKGLQFARRPLHNPGKGEILPVTATQPRTHRQHDLDQPSGCLHSGRDRRNGDEGTAGTIGKPMSRAGMLPTRGERGPCPAAAVVVPNFPRARISHLACTFANGNAWVSDRLVWRRGPSHLSSVNPPRWVAHRGLTNTADG